jgi:hypothetical protein
MIFIGRSEIAAERFGTVLNLSAGREGRIDYP